MEKKLIIFTDIGDTIIDEGTQVRLVPEGVVQSADCIPGAKETMLKLYEAGYTIVMVADGLSRSFHIMMEQNGLDHIFTHWVISEEVGVDKPGHKIFQTAMDLTGLTDADKDRVIMVGNNPLRDILGANRFGIRSVLLDWSPRYDYTKGDNDPDYRSTYRIHEPSELWDLVERLNAELE